MQHFRFLDLSIFRRSRASEFQSFLLNFYDLLVQIRVQNLQDPTWKAHFRQKFAHPGLETRQESQVQRFQQWQRKDSYVVHACMTLFSLLQSTVFRIPSMPAHMLLIQHYLEEDLPPLPPLPEFRPLPWNLPIVTFHGKL